MGYVVSRFPSTTETFIVREMAAIQRLGHDISLSALHRESDTVLQPEAAPFLAALTTATPVGRALLGAQLFWLRRRPLAYLRIWYAAIVGNLGSPKFLARALLAVPAGALFARRAVEQQVDHIHAHWATHSALAAWVVHKLTGLSYGFTAHAHDIYVDRSMLERKIRDAAYVAVISEYNRLLLTRLYPGVESKLHVVRCGVDTNLFAPGLVDARPPGPLRLLCVASLQPYKGHRLLLQAIALLRSRQVDVRLTAAGGGELSQALAELAVELDIADVVDWLGPVSSDEVRTLIQSSDVMVLPSIITSAGKTEGIPVALMEAMASSLPVIASDVAGIPELVVDGLTGLLVPPGDVVALAEAITALQDPNERERLGRAARRHVETEFEIDLNAERLNRLMAAAS